MPKPKPEPKPEPEPKPNAATPTEESAALWPASTPSVAEGAIMAVMVLANYFLMRVVYHQPEQPLILAIFAIQVIFGGVAMSVFPLFLWRLFRGRFFPATPPEGIWTVAAISYLTGISYHILQMQFDFGIFAAAVGSLMWMAVFLLTLAFSIGTRWQHAMVTLFVLATASILVTLMSSYPPNEVTMAEFSKTVAMAGMLLVTGLRLIKPGAESWTTWFGCLTFVIIHGLSTLTLATVVPRLWFYA